jgi:sigma-B regulation protein RsbU (phosphoserine phosphatase)
MPHGVEPPHDVPLSADRWRRVLVVMEKLALSSDLDEILGIVVDAMRDCLGADRASVFQYDAARGELVAARAHGVEAMRLSVERGLAGEAVRTRMIINVPDCQRDARFNPEVDHRTGYVTRSMLSVPLVSFDGVVEGVAQMLNKRTGDQGAGPFGALDEELARGLASQAAVAIRRARLIEAERRKTKIEADLAIAREIQLAALPATLPCVPGYDLAARTIPADETGGDIFDVVELDPAGNGAVLLLVADAAGHGVGPALAVTKLQAMVRLASHLRTPLKDGLESINRQLCDSLPIGRYVAAVVGVLEPGVHRLRTLTAGLSSVMTVRPDGSVSHRSADALALAIDPAWTADIGQDEALPPGAALVIVTDGYTEAMNPRGVMFGLEQVAGSLVAGLREAAGAPAPAAIMLERLEADLRLFAQGRTPADDRTAVVVYRSPLN